MGAFSGILNYTLDRIAYDIRVCYNLNKDFSQEVSYYEIYRTHGREAVSAMG